MFAQQCGKFIQFIIGHQIKAQRLFEFLLAHKGIDNTILEALNQKNQELARLYQQFAGSFSQDLLSRDMFRPLKLNREDSVIDRLFQAIEKCKWMKGRFPRLAKLPIHNNAMIYLEEAQRHVMRLISLKCLAQNSPSQHLNSWMYRSVLNVQWLFERLYKGQCLLQGDIGLVETHDFAHFQHLLNQARIFEEGEEEGHFLAQKRCSHQERILTLNFGLGVHYPHLMTTLSKKSSVTAVNTVLLATKKARDSFHNQLKIPNYQEMNQFFDSVLQLAATEIQVELSEFEKYAQKANAALKKQGETSK